MIHANKNANKDNRFEEKSRGNLKERAEPLLPRVCICVLSERIWGRSLVGVRSISASVEVGVGGWLQWPTLVIE